VTPGAAIKVLIVDDSAIVRAVLSEQLGKVPGIQVVGTAPDPFVARDKIYRLQPDVMTLDVEMPRMDGLTFLRKVMAHNPIPTIVFSSLTPEGSGMAMDALQSGALDVVPKPGVAYSVGEVLPVLVEKIRAAARAERRNLKRAQAERGAPAPGIGALRRTTNRFIAMGASTGGTCALETVLTRLPHNSPGIVIVQHMPANFTRLFAERLDKICEMDVSEAKDDDAVLPGRVLVAPGNRHMLLAREGARYVVKLRDGQPVHHQRPAVDVLFHSVAMNAGANAVGVLLTGMGSDGAEGLSAMRNAGSLTIAQDQETSVVWGMPGAAVKLNAASRVLPLDRIAAEMIAAATA
jgi:two-component system chemotaxis response regulator CheB